MVRVGEGLRVPPADLARVLTELRVPRPPLGYWTQLEAGKAAPRPELPPSRPGDLTEWRPGAQVKTSVRATAKAARLAKPDMSEDVESVKDNASKASSNTGRSKKMSRPTKTHELLIGAKPHFLKTRKVENGILRPFKRLLVDILTSEQKLDSALLAAQTLFEALNKQGFHVGFTAAGERMYRYDVELLDKPRARHRYHRSPWAPDRPTVVRINGSTIGLTLFEMTEEVEAVYVGGDYIPVQDLSERQLRIYTGSHHWRTQIERPSGKLGLQAYSTSALVKWSKRWTETKAGTFNGLVSGLVGELEAAAPKLQKELAEARLRADEQRREWEEERRRQEAEAQRLRREKARNEARQDILAAIAAWGEAKRMLDFFTSVEAELHKRPTQENTDLLERLRLCRELVGDPDPLALLKEWKAPQDR